jgi:hypothetical protein
MTAAEQPPPERRTASTPITASEFARSFRDDHEMGRDITDTTLTAYFENGQHVARIVEDRRSTRSHPERLDPEDAAAARHWFARLRRQEQDSLAAATGRAS